MSHKKILALAEKFLIKLAISDEEKTNPGGKDIGTPEHVISDKPLVTAPRQMPVPRIRPQKDYEGPTRFYDVNLNVPTHITEPGLQRIPPEVRPFAEELFYRVNKVIYEIMNDFGSLKASGYFHKPRNTKRATYYNYMIDTLRFLAEGIRHEPYQAARQIKDVIDTDKIIEYHADIIKFMNDYTYNVLNIVPGKTLTGPKPKGLWHLLQLKQWIKDNLPF